MVINEIVKLRTNEKKDCKISETGIVWLRKGQYKQRIKQLDANRVRIDRGAKTANELLTNMVQSLQKFEPSYFKNTTVDFVSYEKKDKGEKKVRCSLYYVNKRKVRARLTNFSNTEFGDKRMYFYSISFPLGMDEKISTKLLNSVLTTLRKDYGVVHYLWIAERQKKGQKHYHLCLYHYVKGRIVNDIVKKYIKHAIRKKELNWSTASANNYNGVDISKDRKTGIPTNFAGSGTGKHIARYITKYVSKSSGAFEGQAWNCSRSVASVTDGICATIEEVLTMYTSDILSDNATYENEWCYFFPWKKEAPPDYKKLIYEINTSRIASLN
jgi:hypothetical protein